MERDIASRDDVKELVNSFYEKVRVNPVIGYIFNDVAKVDWSAHLPKMYDFWSGIILGEQLYKGNPMTVHIQLSKLTSLTETEFSEWLFLFNSTIDELFTGPNAEEAKTRAANIARLMLYKVSSN